MKNNKKDINEDGVVEVNLEDLDTPKVAGQNTDSESSESEVEEFVDLGDDGEELSKKDVVKKLREKIKGGSNS